LNPDKDLAQYHTIVLTENKPSDVFTFESNIDKSIRAKLGSSNVYIEYIHGIGSSVNDFNECLELINKSFYDLGSTTFTIKRQTNEESGNIVVISWRNPYQKRLKSIYSHLA
jgi:hypothetical protein